MNNITPEQIATAINGLLEENEKLKQENEELKKMNCKEINTAKAIEYMETYNKVITNNSLIIYAIKKEFKHILRLLKGREENE